VNPKTQLIKRFVDPKKLRFYLRPPGSAYRHWNQHKRAWFWARRVMYQRILAEQQAGRCFIVPRVRPCRQEPVDPAEDVRQEKRIADNAKKAKAKAKKMLADLAQFGPELHTRTEKRRKRKD
jgi:hypothetical protein